MIENYRRFEATDLFDRKWKVEFLWQQTAISIRHADAVDVKWQLSTEGEFAEKVVALPHTLLLDASKKHGHQLNDPWCMKLAAVHLKQMIETWQDMDKTLITLTSEEIDAAAKAIAGWEAHQREVALHLD